MVGSSAALVGASAAPSTPTSSQDQFSNLEDSSHPDLALGRSRKQVIKNSVRLAANCIQISQVTLLIISLLLLLVTSEEATTTENVSQMTTTTTWPPHRQLRFRNTNERINLIEADENEIYLLGLFDIHQSNPRVPFKCGPMEVDEVGGDSRRPMQNMEAFLWAIEQVNADRTLLPGVQLGSVVMDTCSSFLRVNQQLANLLHSPHEPQLPHPNQLAAIVADQSDWQSVGATVNMASAQKIATFVTQSRSSKLGELVKKYNQQSQGDNHNQNQKSSATSRIDFGASLNEESVIVEQPSSVADRQPLQLDKLLGELLGIGQMLPSLNFTQEQQQRVLMVRMVLGNELQAEALATLMQQMGWDLVSVVYDDELDIVDLHDELAKQMLAKNLQFALDEQLPLNSGAEIYDRLLHSLATKTEIGSRVVICLLSATSSRLLLESLKQLRAVSKGNKLLLEQVNQILWVTVADREPYYSFADEALGTVAVSSATSLMPEFKAYYDHLEAKGRESLKNNRWWPEYLSEVVAANQRVLTAESLQCYLGKASQEPNQKCRPLSLSSIASSSAGGDSNARLSKYLAGGWEHNGMDVINSVLAVANGLEAVRQALCPRQANGLCAKMRELIIGTNPHHTLSELLYAELLGSTFQLADGRMFNLDEFQSQGGQLEGKFKLYNLRHLQQNSIGFVKFGHYDQVEGLEMNVTKARHYPRGQQFADQRPLEQLKSSCQDENRCLLAASLRETATAVNKQSISEEELAAGVNSLFKLDHPSFTEPISSSSHLQPATTTLAGQPQVHTMRSTQLNWRRRHRANETIAGKLMTFNTIVLLPLHNSNNKEEHQSSGEHQGNLESSQAASCSPRLDVSQSFQHLTALAYAQTLANGLTAQSAGAGQSQIELTTTVIDYCNRPQLARRLLEAQLASSSALQQDLERTVAVIDFDAQVSDQLGLVLGPRKLLHLTIDSPRHQQDFKSIKPPKHHLRLLPSKSNEIQALVKVIGAMARWQLVHLIYTDHHHYRDEFVKLANEAQICVNKLIWIPSIGGDDVELDQNQLRKTLTLFKRELYDYSTIQTNKTSTTQAQQGLNATRLLVVLASSEAKTNQLILKAATKSMLDDYVWLVSHEWLNSVELMAESRGQQETTRSLLPRHLLATRFESFGESHSFRSYYSSLTPSLHQPLPTKWFDQFWQQHFKCRLPTALIKSQFPENIETKTCSTSQHLEGEKLAEDERVRYAIQAYESIYSALQAQTSSKNPPALNWSQEQFNAHFRSVFEESRSQVSGLSGSNQHLNKSPYGFHILHRLLPNTSQGRRENSRRLVDVGDEMSQLVRVGLWRDNQLVLMRPPPTSSNNTSSAWWMHGDGVEEDSGKILSSLAKLAAIKSRCLLQNTCQLCRQQLEQSAALAKQEAARSRLNESGQDPNAMSSFSINSHETAIYAFDEDDDGDEEEEATTTKATQGLDLASSASLFEPKTSKQVRDNELRLREHLHRHHHQLTSISIGRAQRRISFVLMSSLSLAGVVCMLLSLSYLYPSMLLRKEASFGPSSTPRLAKADANLANLNDYFLLTGLLMLYSINLAFLLPVTMSVCWFRRIGLATSYTLIFSSLLNKVLSSWRDSKLEQAGLVQAKSRSGTQSSNQTVVGDQPDPIEEGVEVTFESLPPEAADAQVAQLEKPNQEPMRSETNFADQTQFKEQFKGWKPTSLLSLSLGLVLVQLLVALIWFLQQPPEPTFYLNCWRCASPSRSRTLYLFEPLLSLLYPALILLPAWLFSVLAFKMASRNEEILRISNKLKTTDENLHQKQKQLDEKLREAKSLVMTTTLLVLTWSLLTLNTISTASSLRFSLQQQHQQQQQQGLGDINQVFKQFQEPPNAGAGAPNADDLDLVLANILSGAIIFSFLFIYRLHLFQYCFNLSNKFRPHHQHETLSSRNLQVLKYNQPGELMMQRPQRQQERLRLQQFNTNNYSTYAATSERSPNPNFNPNLNQPCANDIRKHLQKHRRHLFGSDGVKVKTKPESRLQRRQSAGSVASSTAKLVGNSSSQHNSSLALDSNSLKDEYFDDTISCASSVASSSTSQVQGNELYPLDYSIQLEASADPQTLNRSASFSRRSQRRPSVKKLSSVSEETSQR